MEGILDLLVEKVQEGALSLARDECQGEEREDSRGGEKFENSQAGSRGRKDCSDEEGRPHACFEEGAAEVSVAWPLWICGLYVQRSLGKMIAYSV